jgi:HD-like signal output (HDOD) protein
MKVQEFLNQNISLSERELTPILGIRNVKTLYNAFKQDVMFTFYDNLYGTHEKSWNLCYNEALGIFTTFYSWIPSEM